MPPFLNHHILNDKHIKHGFFTRHGGFSSGVYESLNCGLGSNDDITLAHKNREIAAAAIGGKDDAISGLYQIHSNICHIADPIKIDRPEGDALVTDKPHITLAILTADCVPVLFADPKNKVIGAAHAGWRGAVRGIITSTVDKMLQIGAVSENIKAVIGPAIQQKSYQVSFDLRDEVLSKHPNSEHQFIPDSDGKWKFNLPGFVSDLLVHHDIQHHRMNEDTYSDDRFFSHRRNTHQNGIDTGRLVSMIRLDGN